MSRDNPLGLPVVLLSHRGPASFRRTPSGLTIKRGAGGLVTALMGVLTVAVDAYVAAEHEGHSIEIAFSPHPQIVDEDSGPTGPTLNVRYVDVDRDQHDAFYTKIANPLLWFVQHGLYGSASGNTCDFVDATKTLRSFVTAYPNLGTSLSAGSLAAAGGADTTWFRIGVKLPTSADNTYQGRAATLTLNWHITQ